MLWAQHLWREGNERGLAEGESKLQCRAFLLLWSTAQDVRVTPHWAQKLDLYTSSFHQPWKWAALGMACSWRRRQKLRQVLLWRGYLVVVPPCLPQYMNDINLKVNIARKYIKLYKNINFVFYSWHEEMIKIKLYFDNLSKLANEWNY